MTTHESASLPLISVIVPCRNEEKSIVRCLKSIVENNYPKDRMEILVVDGMSEDKSREVAIAFLSQHNISFSVIQNPERVTPFALNRGIARSKGDIIGTVGGHNFISSNYLREVAKILSKGSADCAGGRGECIPMGEGLMTQAIAQVMRSKFGVGGSFRSNNGKKEFVDTVPSPFYKKEVFARAGFFNEKLTRSQDIEFNRRIKRFGSAIVMDPDIVSFYYDRATWRTFTRQKFINGIWSILPFRFADHVPVSLRHLVPLFFVGGLIASVLLGLALPWMMAVFFLTLASYTALNAFVSLHIARENGLSLFPYLFLLFFSLHVSYGLGSLWGVVLLTKHAISRLFHGRQ